MDRRATEGTLLIELGGRPVEYRFARRRRRTLGITVDADGLRVAAPVRASWRDIEAFLRAKERWILAKLDKWSQVPRPRLLAGASGESLPYSESGFAAKFIFAPASINAAAISG